MFLQIAIGTSLIVLTVLLAAILMGLALQVSQRLEAWLVRGHVHLKNALVTGALSLLLVAVMTSVTWIWALALRALGIFGTFEESLYFSIVAFTTLGLGDLTLPREWRLLSGFVAMDGFILFGLSTAFLFESLRGLRSFQNGRRDAHRQP